MRNRDLDALQIFKAVADHGGVSRAAAHLNRVQSNVSTRLKQLEATLETPLFRRQNRRLVLSEPVSYTHLDVYKRQGIARRAGPR